MLSNFSQVKLSSTGIQQINNLFHKFHFNKAITKGYITKRRGHSPIKIFTIMILIILENRKSIYEGICRLFITKLKTPINDFLNNPNYHWRNFLYSIAKRFTELCPADHEEGVVIADDTAKEKTGRKGEHTSWFRNHCKNTCYMGFQNITLVWSNLRTTIPIDFEMKTGKKKVKHSRDTKYEKGTHIDQRIRFAKKSKNKILIQMIKRAMQRRFKFKLILWDSWYSCSETIKFVFKYLIPKGKMLISMLKNNQTKYRLINRNRKHFLNLKELKNKAGKWILDSESGIKYKSIIVDYLDVSSSSKIDERVSIGKIKIAFFRYPNTTKFRAILCTDLEINEMQILKHYFKRWSVECIFKDMKQYFGYSQNKSSKYSAMISDTSIRYAFYIMFCYKKEKSNGEIAAKKRSTEQILLEFYEELFEGWLSDFVELMFKRYLEHFLDYAEEMGFTNITDIKANFEAILKDFFNKDFVLEKIKEM